MKFSERPPRYPAHIPVVLSHGGETQSAFIVDINMYGAGLTGIQALDRDDVVTLRGATESNVATVRWTEEDRAGIYFDRPIPPQYLAMLRLRSQTYRAAPPIMAMRQV